MCAFERTTFSLPVPIPTFLKLLVFQSRYSMQILSLTCDGLTGAIQERLRKCEVHALHMMYAVNVYSAAYCLIGECMCGPTHTHMHAHTHTHTLLPTLLLAPHSCHSNWRRSGGNWLHPTPSDNPSKFVSIWALQWYWTGESW